MEKKKKEISTVLLGLFVCIIIILGGAMYFLKNYYLADIAAGFESDGNRAILTSKKTKTLKHFDLNVFKGDRYTVLEKGYWHETDEASLVVGNPKPFESISFLEDENKEDQEEN